MSLEESCGKHIVDLLGESTVYCLCLNCVRNDTDDGLTLEDLLACHADRLLEGGVLVLEPTLSDLLTKAGIVKRYYLVSSFIVEIRGGSLKAM